MKTSEPLRRRSGFTLLELLVVIAAIAILAGVTLAGLNHAGRKQAREQAKTQLHLLQGGLESYASDHGGAYPKLRNPAAAGNQTRDDGSSASRLIYLALYPTGASGNVYLEDLDPDHDRQGWLLGQTSGGSAGLTIHDPWGQEYRYRVGEKAMNSDFDLWSSGPDQKTRAGANGEYDPSHPDNLDDIRGW